MVIQTAATVEKTVRAYEHRDSISLLCLGIVDLEQIPTGRFASIVPRYKILTEAREKVESLMKEFRKQAREIGIEPARIETHRSEGEPFQKIIQHHVMADLVIMGPTCSFPPALHDYPTLVHLFRQASRPVLLVADQERTVKTLVMVMDGTASSSRMLYAYAHLRLFPEENILVVHSKYEEEYHDLRDFFDNVMEFLDGCGIKAEKSGWKAI